MASAISFPDDNDIVYRFVDWVEWGDKAYDLAAQILTTDHTFDRLVALGTGGLTLSRAMKDYLNIAKVSTMTISFYTGIGSKGKTPVITQSVATNIEGEKVLLFDDINDSGKTIETARAYLMMRGASDIVTSTIFQKPGTACPSDYFVAETNEWIIFPDEVRETITLLSGKWIAQGVSPKTVDKRLHDIGFTARHIDLVLGIK
jgi:hypoxanthine phosphoribosyltransferase